MEVVELTKTTLSEQIMEQIANQIVSEKLKPGEKLPTEREFATMFNVTRNRVREALRALSLIGMITIKPGGGSFVSSREDLIPQDTVIWMYHRELQNVDDVYSARKLIEKEVYLTFFDNKDDEKIKNLESLFDKIKKTNIKKISVKRFSQLLDDLDLFVGKECGNGVYTKLMQTIILLRKDSNINILNVPGSKKSAINSREKIINSMINGSKVDLEHYLEEFYKVSLENLHK